VPRVSSGERLIFPSAGWLIFRWSRIGRPADDRALPAVYRDVMHVLLAALRRLRSDPLRLDWALAAALALAAEVQVWLGGIATHERVVPALVAVVVTASVAVRRRYPASVGIAAAALVAVELGVWGDAQVIATSIAYLCALYGLTVWTPPRRFVLGAALTVIAGFSAAAGPKGHLRNSVTFTVVTLAIMLLVRRVLGDRERRARIAERERDVAAREAVVEERARIARELHDVIAHHVSMIVVQAGAERRVLGEANASTREVLETVEQIGRGALTETRRLLGMLRGDASESLTPQPGLGDVPALVGQLREAGLPVELQVEGERRELPVGIELSAYRIVQEALTNALKHAGEARATVHVRYGAEALELEIADDGAGGAARAAGGGHGLVGMRERVALYGGRFQASRNPGGGFVVRVLLPIR
jgi:signal transduction histidine kinase